MTNSVKVKRSYLLEYVSGTPWAITEAKMDAIQCVLFNHISNKEVDLSSIEASLGKELRNDHEVLIQGGSAIIPVMGVIAKRMNLMQRISGGVSTEALQQDIEAALADDQVSQIVLRMDSPGGTVDGVKELSDFIYESRGKKPIIAFVDGEAASAAYWLASAADKIVAYDTARVGHIGVWQAHYDYSKAYEKEGIKKTYLHAGKYKVAGHEAAPLEGEMKDYVQGQVDTYYSLFVNSVARNRGVSTDTVLKDMADGRIFIGNDALKVGLIDQIGRFTDVVKGGKVSRLRDTANDGLDDNNDDDLNGKREDCIMNLKELKEKHPDLVLALESEAKAVLGEDGDRLRGEKAALATKVEELSAKVEVLDTVNRDLVKSLSLMEEKSSSALAENVKRSILAESSVPDNLHDKIMGMVDYHAHVRQGERFEEGSESVKAFKEAFAGEVSDWESRLPVSGVGLGESKRDLTSAAAIAQGDDEKYGRELARQYAGSIRSDEK